MNLGRQNFRIQEFQMSFLRDLITRCREHLGINKAGIQIKESSSAIRDHINQLGHAASVNDFSILDRAKNDF